MARQAVIGFGCNPVIQLTDIPNKFFLDVLSLGKATDALSCNVGNKALTGAAKHCGKSLKPRRCKNIYRGIY
jgi:hypothetical protein